jgi:hypothetical protein
MSAHVLPPLAVNNKSERKINSMPPLGFEPVTIGMLVHLSDHSAKSHPQGTHVQPDVLGPVSVLESVVGVFIRQVRGAANIINNNKTLL